jgi:hypothetical protein
MAAQGGCPMSAVKDGLKVVGGLLLFVGFVLLAGLLAFVFIQGGLWVSTKLYPILVSISGLTLAVVIFVLLPNAVWSSTPRFAGSWHDHRVFRVWCISVDVEFPARLCGVGMDRTFRRSVYGWVWCGSSCSGRRLVTRGVVDTRPACRPPCADLRIRSVGNASAQYCRAPNRRTRKPSVSIHRAITGTKRSVGLAVCLLALASAADGQPRSFKCKEPLPEFTLGKNSNPSEEQLTKLCGCIWSKLPEGGWERRVAAQVRNGEDPGWRWCGFVPRFGKAIEACGGDRL